MSAEDTLGRRGFKFCKNVMRMVTGMSPRVVRRMVMRLGTKIVQKMDDGVW